MARMIPSYIGRFDDPMYHAEAVVWRELFHSLGDEYFVFYSVVPSGGRRETDFVVAGPQGMVFIEVKGGRIFADGPPAANIEWVQETPEGAKRVHPPQLWNAKHDIQDALVDLGFGGPQGARLRGGELYVFPNTPSCTLSGANDGPQKLVLGCEDLPDLGKWVSVAQSKYAAGSEYILRRDQILGELERWSYRESAVASESMLASRVTAADAIDPKRQRWHWAVAAGLLVVVGAGSWVLAGRHDAVVANPSKSVPVTASVRKTTPKSARNPLVPPFVAPGAEGAFISAYGAAKGLGPGHAIEWRHGGSFGFITLSSLTDDGCANYRFTRNDVRPMELLTKHICD